MFPIKKIFYLFSILLISQHSLASDNNCYMKYYQNRDIGCVENFVEQINAMPENSAQKLYAGIGFFAEVFSTDKHKKRLFKQAVTPSSQIVFTEALLYAQKPKEAEDFAKEHGLTKFFETRAQQKYLPLNKIIPKTNAAYNDLLLGAFFASGKEQYIQAIWQNMALSSEQKAKDAIRLGLLKLKFGDRFAPKGRKSEIVNHACQKYHCKKDAKDFIHLLTLTTTYWSTHSLAAEHPKIQKTINAFFKKHKALSDAHKLEQQLFSNYLTISVVSSALDKKSFQDYLTEYEKFEIPKISEIKNALDSVNPQGTPPSKR